MFVVVMYCKLGFEIVEDDVVYYNQEQNIQICVGVVVYNDVVYIGNLLCCQVSIVSNFFFVLVCYVEEVFYLWVGVEQFQVQCSGGVDKQLYSWNNSYLDVLGVFYFNQYNGVQYQCYGCQYLVGDIEQWLQVFNVVQWINYVLIQQVVLQIYIVCSIDDIGNQRIGFFQEWDEVIQQVLQYKVVRMGICIQCGQDEQGFEQNIEVILEVYVSYWQYFVEYVCDIYCQCWCVICMVQDRRFINVFCGLQDLFW